MEGIGHEFEVFAIACAIGLSLNSFDLVVGSFHWPRRNSMLEVAPQALFESRACFRHCLQLSKACGHGPITPGTQEQLSGPPDNDRMSTLLPLTLDALDLCQSRLDLLGPVRKLGCRQGCVGGSEAGRGSDRQKLPSGTSRSS